MHHHHHRHGQGSFEHGGPGWMKFAAMGRRGGWRFGGPGGGGFGGAGFGGDWGGFGDNMRIGRMLASGDLRLIALYFIEQQPRHGYELIKAIEDQTKGVYVPSPGVVYPALTYLEEAGYVTSTAEGNKRLYTITDTGRAHLADNRSAVQGTLEHLARIGEQMHKVRERWEEVNRQHGGAGPDADRDLDEVAPAVNDARRALKQAIREALRRRDDALNAKLGEILSRAAEDIRKASRDVPPGDAEIDI